MKARKVGSSEVRDGVMVALQMPPREFEAMAAGIEAEVRALRLARRILSDPAQWVEGEVIRAEARVHARWDRFAGPDNGGGAR